MKSALAFAQFLSDNYLTIITLIAVIAGLVIKVKRFLSKSREEQNAIIDAQKAIMIEKVKECLLSWVTEAETDWGRFTGKIKRSQVMSLIFTQFPELEDWLSTEEADQLIDDAKKILDALLESNKELYNKVYGHYPDELEDLKESVETKN